ncbi:hypothetical protein K438DRAFT_1749343 [Mycena galopus ATCC 62051]|nr:hypothetical protein K438DRAFT_1749343 [Mycena galopus ATCC 62051]
MIFTTTPRCRRQALSWPWPLRCCTERKELAAPTSTSALESELLLLLEHYDHKDFRLHDSWTSSACTSTAPALTIKSFGGHFRAVWVFVSNMMLNDDVYAVTALLLGLSFSPSMREILDLSKVGSGPKTTINKFRNWFPFRSLALDSTLSTEILLFAVCGVKWRATLDEGMMSST